MTSWAFKCAYLDSVAILVHMEDITYVARCLRSTEYYVVGYGKNGFQIPLAIRALDIAGNEIG